MNRRAILLALAAHLLLTGCFRPYPTYRYRMTVEVDTPEGLRRGSTVIEVRSRFEDVGLNQIITHKLTAEAAVVDLGRRGTFFALLRSDDDIDWAKLLYYKLTQFPRSPAGTNMAEDGAMANEIITRNTGLITLPRRFITDSTDSGRSGYPTLIRFRNQLDSGSKEYIDPENMAKTFGPGVKLRRVTVALTSDRPSNNIERLLP